MPPDAERVVSGLLDALEQGTVRAAEKDAQGRWRAVPWVKQGILLAFRAGSVVDMSPELGAPLTGRGAGTPFRFFDKHTLPFRELRLEDGVRVVPGGSSIRRGTYLAPGVVCMPPIFVNAGAWIGAGTMIDVVIVRIGDDRDRLHGSARDIRIDRGDPSRRTPRGGDEPGLRRLEPLVRTQPVVPRAHVRQRRIQARIPLRRLGVQEKGDHGVHARSARPVAVAKPSAMMPLDC